MSENSTTLNVEQIEKEYRQKTYNVCRWIREGKVKAETQGKAYLVDRASLEEYLAKKGQKIAASEVPVKKGEASPDKAGGSQQTAEQVKPSKVAEAGKFPVPPDLWAGAEPVTSKIETPRREDQPTQRGKTQPAKRDEPKQNHEASKRKSRKGPVRYVKDSARHLDLVQMLDVLDWLIRRITAGIAGTNIPPKK